MSLAIPASYDEYYYTSQNDGLICDGGIMPLRNSADPTSTWYKYCLRAEDLMFLNEALNIKGKCARYNTGVPTPSKNIDSSRLSNIRDNIGYIWDSGSPTMPSLQPHDFGDDYTGLRQYIQDSFGSKTRYSANDSYYRNPLRADQIMNLFKDVKQLNYFYRQGGGRGSAVPYSFSRGCVTQRTYSDGTSPDTFTYDFVWYDQIYYRSYDGTVDYHWDEHPTSKSLTFSLYSSGDMIPKTLVELAIWGGFYVTNYAGKMNEYSEYGEVTNKTTYVFVPIKSAYTNMANVSVPTVSDSELNVAINLAYSTAGMEKNALDIPCGLPTGSYHTIHHDAYSQCQLWDIIYLTHPFYCTLENVNVD